MAGVQIAPGVVQHGNQDYSFGFDDPAAQGIGSTTGLVPQDLSVSGEPEFTAEGKDLYGLTVAFVKADQKYNFTMSGYVVDKDLLDEASGTFTYEGKYFIVTSSKKDVSFNEFQKGEIQGVAFPLINS